MARVIRVFRPLSVASSAGGLGSSRLALQTGQALRLLPGMRDPLVSVRQGRGGVGRVPGRRVTAHEAVATICWCAWLLRAGRAGSEARPGAVGEERGGVP
ncbi:hypothetical protein GCM10009716_17090 [Streptomyces sodiiphilus]|uniref:Uncharacterized protein n=1 Tax=Streptomyces sodiiphilus TaxID=226217 RepID=A0ABN2NZ28_9ACTN